MIRRSVRIGIEAGLFIALLGGIVWATGRPFLFPSLGPTAFALAVRGETDLSARNVIGGHFCGVVAGLAVYHSVAAGITLDAVLVPFSTGGLLLSASGALSVALTAWGMLLARASHPPACATTLIISLGLLPAISDGLIIMASVILLYAVHEGVFRLRRSDP